MTNQERIEKINKWQNAGVVHPLTCGVSSCRSILVAKELSNDIVLICPAIGCGYVQTFIPDVVLHADIDSIIASSICLKENKSQ